MSGWLVLNEHHGTDAGGGDCIASNYHHGPSLLEEHDITEFIDTFRLHWVLRIALVLFAECLGMQLFAHMGPHTCLYPID